MPPSEKLNSLERHESARRAGNQAVAVRRRTASRTLVRPATPADLEAVVALRLALLREEIRNPFFANPHPDADRRAHRLTKAELTAPGQAFLVAVRGDEVVGMLRCRAVRRSPLVIDGSQAIVTTVYVVPSQRRAGVLRSLVQAADQWCREHRLTGMRLQCALSNDVGRTAWESLGFKPAEVLYLRDIPPV